MSVLKYKHENVEGYLVCYEEEGKFYTLSKFHTQKVTNIIQDGFMMVTNVLESDDYEKYSASINTDFDFAKEIFRKLKDSGNSYFKTLEEDLCVIILEK